MLPCTLTSHMYSSTKGTNAFKVFAMNVAIAQGQVLRGEVLGQVLRGEVLTASDKSTGADSLSLTVDKAQVLPHSRGCRSLSHPTTIKNACSNKERLDVVCWRKVT